jgi:hypothetical protein
MNVWTRDKSTNTHRCYSAIGGCIAMITPYQYYDERGHWIDGLMATVFTPRGTAGMTWEYTCDAKQWAVDYHRRAVWEFADREISL